MNLFADDTFVWISGSSSEDCVNLINDDLIKVHCYTVISTLKLNLRKTVAVIIGSTGYDFCVIEN